jgi:hypothetical protein
MTIEGAGTREIEDAAWRVTFDAAPVPSRLAVSRQAVLDLGVVAALLAITLWRLLPAVDSMPFHRDEARWIGNSALLREWRHPLGPKWQDEGYPVQYGSLDERNRRRSQPPLAMYVFGLGLLAQGRGLPHTGYWIMDQDTKWNTEHGNMPSSSEIRAARRTSVVVAALTVIALFFIGSRLTNRVGGMTGAVLYALHPLTLATSSRALSDPLLALCVALAALAAIWFMMHPTWGRGALLGLALGLGGATKLSPLGVAVGVGVLGVILLVSALLWRETSAPRLRRVGLRLLIVPAIAGLVFVAVYPYLWTDPIEHTRRMLDFRTESFRLQRTVSPDATIDNRTEAFRRVGDELGRRNSTGGVIADWLADHVDAGDWLSPIPGLPPGGGKELWLRELDLVLAAAGWVLLTGIAVRRGWSDPAMLIAAVIGGQALLIILSVDILYLRYLLPVLLAVAIGAGVAVGVGWERGALLLRRHMASESGSARMIREM